MEGEKIYRSALVKTGRRLDEETSTFFKEDQAQVEGKPSPDDQQLCPLRQFPDTFLHFDPDNRPNPLRSERGSHVLNLYQATMMNFESQVPQNELLFAPQGVHPGTGQALPPLFNSKTERATGENISSLSMTGKPFSFQVVNNNYNISTCSSSHLQPVRNQGLVMQVHKGRIGKKGISKRNTEKVQQLFTTPLLLNRAATPTVSLSMPRCAKYVSDILQWWFLGCPSKNLQKPLMLWSKDERNRMNDNLGKKISIRLLYAKRKTVALSFFHFCKTKTVEEYEQLFTSLKKPNLISKNYEKSSKYYKDKDLSTLFSENQGWIDWTKSVAKLPHVKHIFE